MKAPSDYCQEIIGLTETVIKKLGPDDQYGPVLITISRTKGVNHQFIEVSAKPNAMNAFWEQVIEGITLGEAELIAFVVPCWFRKKSPNDVLQELTEEFDNVFGPDTNPLCHEMVKVITSNGKKGEMWCSEVTRSEDQSPQIGQWFSGKSIKMTDGVDHKTLTHAFQIVQRNKNKNRWKK